ncbi:inositol 1,4,5-triphosphate receptor associated 1 isoform X2 [Polypterus senegalus]|uniref:inositol 1,4,5-triphosphate receptor associated 1 isoform X2 n=1 Tax=Polypterus senegalus TaxID=55291 RepID=UPI00196322FF|nr:inositol 1,4,5-triphosphate receptor associated 1 isoform X2 [Polypterus senegalus]
MKCFSAAHEGSLEDVNDKLHIRRITPEQRKDIIKHEDDGISHEDCNEENNSWISVCEDLSIAANDLLLSSSSGGKRFIKNSEEFTGLPLGEKFNQTQQHEKNSNEDSYGHEVNENNRENHSKVSHHHSAVSQTQLQLKNQNQKLIILNQDIVCASPNFAHFQSCQLCQKKMRNQQRSLETLRLIIPKGAVHLPLSSTRKLSLLTRSLPNCQRTDNAGNVIDLINDKLPDVELSDEDKKKNLELLEEAKKASEHFSMRRGRRSTCSISDSPTVISPATTPRSSPVPSRSSSLTITPQLDGATAILGGSSTTPQLLLDVPGAKETADNKNVEFKNSRKGLVDQKGNDQKKAAQQKATMPCFASFGSSNEMSLQKENWDPLLVSSKSSNNYTETKKGSFAQNQKSQENVLVKATAKSLLEYNEPTSRIPQTSGFCQSNTNYSSKTSTVNPLDTTGECIAEVRSFGACPPIMRAVSWDNVEQATVINRAPSSPTKTNESFGLPDITSSQLLNSSGYKDFPIQPMKKQKLAKLREEHKLMRNQSLAGSKLPDLSETAEHEGGPSSQSFPCQTSEEHPTGSRDVMPNISDIMLHKLKLHKPPGSSPLLSEKEVETAFVQLSLAFRNDSYTLETRLKLMERERNVTEENTEKELEEFKGALKSTVIQLQTLEQRESYQRLMETIAVLHRLATRLSSRAEMVGAVRQEKRMSKATEVMMQYVENLKRTYEKDHAELIEFKKLANQNTNRSYSGSIDGGDDGIPRTARSMSLTLGKALPRRRVSVAVVPKFNMLNIPVQPTSVNTIPSLSPLYETSPGKSIGPTSQVSAPLHENGKPSEHQEVDNFSSSSSSKNQEDIPLEIKAKIEDDAYNKGYQDGLKRSKEMEEVKDEEDKQYETQRDLEENKNKMEANKEQIKNRKFEDALGFINKLFPKVFQQQQLLWISIVVVVVLVLMGGIFTSFNKSCTDVSGKSTEESVCNGEKSYFSWNS